MNEVKTRQTKRDHWSGRLDFFLSCVGLSVGLGNVWRFPYLCYKNGGGAFLIPYVIVLICAGAPIYILEVAIGQYMQLGGVGCWKICPMFEGIGIATMFIVNYVSIYYIVIMAWTGYYFVMGWSSVLPWSHCNNPWNTNSCRLSVQDINHTLTLGANVTVQYTDPVVEFWTRKILAISPGIEQPEGFVWQLVLSLFAMWCVCYASLFLGVKLSGKVMYFAATFPYVVLTCLLIRGATLPGAIDGVIYYLKPDFSRLADSQVWIDAGTQIFYSYALANGALTALGSYNKFNQNFYRDCKLICLINSGTSLYSGFAIFTTLGFMAHQQDQTIDQVAEKGPGLTFIAYPKAVTQMPLAPLWSAMFFFMLLLLGLDSQFVCIESAVTIILDWFPRLRTRKGRALVVLGFCCTGFIVGLIFVTKGGMYVFQIFDYYAASGITLLWVCFFQCVAVAWFFGGWRFYDAIELMIGCRISAWLWVCWGVLAPLCCAGIFLFSVCTFKGLVYNNIYVYPRWANVMGVLISVSSMAWVPGVALYKFARVQGPPRQRLTQIMTPELRPEQIPTKWLRGPEIHEFTVV